MIWQAFNMKNPYQRWQRYDAHPTETHNAWKAVHRGKNPCTELPTHTYSIVCFIVLQIRKVVCEWLAWALRMSRPGKDLSRQFLLRKARMRELEARTPPSVSLISNVKDVDNAIPLNEFPPLRSVKMEDGGILSVKNELLAILNELRFITHKIKEDNEANEETNDWKFAAMVIDRLCIWTFSVYMVVATVAIFFSSPNILAS